MNGIEILNRIKAEQGRPERLTWAADKAELNRLNEEARMVTWMDTDDYGMPQAEGWYLCAFNDGSVETFYIDESMFEEGWVSDSGKLWITYWADLPKHPEAR